MTVPPTPKGAASSNADTLLREGLFCINSLLDRAQTSEDLCQSLMHGLLTLGIDAIWLGRLLSDGQVEPEYCVSDAGEYGLPALPPQADADPKEPLGLLSRAWHTGETQVVDDWHTAPHRMPDCTLPGCDSNWRSSAALPLIANGHTIAVFCLYSRQPGFFSADPWPLLLDHLRHALGNTLRRIELAQDLAEQRQHLTEMALRDPLTNLRNRVALEDHIQSAMARARRQETLLVVGMLDLDEFKPINDTYGHDAGDEVLKVIATRLQQSLRETDGVFRYGGDEFVLLLENILNFDDLGELLQRMGENLAAPIKLPQNQVRVGASLGVVVYPFGVAEDNSPGALLRQADQALYSLKRDKTRRDNWWSIYAPGKGVRQGGAAAADNIYEMQAYGPHAALLLKPMTDAVAKGQFRPWIYALYQQILQADDAPQLLNVLSDGETQHLLDVLETHAHLLCDPELDAQSHRRAALTAGHTHAVLGIEIGTLMESHDLLIHVLQRIAQTEGRQSHTLTSLLSRRVSLDLRWQTQAYHDLDKQRQNILAQIDALVWDTERYSDLAQGVVDALLQSAEIESATIGRPAQTNEFEFEFVAGAGFKKYLEALSKNAARPISTDAQREEGGGPTGRAWRTGQIERCRNYATDPAMTPWRELAHQLGFRSNAAIPLRSPRGEPQAVLTLYCPLPGGYSSEAQNHFLQRLQHSLGHALHEIELREGRTEAVSHSARRHWRELIEKGLEMHYQPVINLHDGRFVKVEALARLRDGGMLLSPAQFLPTFTSDDLRTLFEHGLEQALIMRRRWHGDGYPLALSVNLPTQALTDPSYVDITRTLLNLHPCPGTDLFLEVLEHDESEDSTMRVEILNQLAELGVRLSEDDLGVGYSSLHRLNLLPFDMIKIDQALVRGILNEPQRLLVFIRQLTRLGHDLGLSVSVEGLETAGLIEAAAILGADFGQGYAIMHPLSAEQVLPWAKNYANPLAGSPRPSTALGAMASFILWEEQLRSVDHEPTLRSQFVELPSQYASYINSHELAGTKLAQTYQRLRATAARESPDISADYQLARKAFLRELSSRIVP